MHVYVCGHVAYTPRNIAFPAFPAFPAFSAFTPRTARAALSVFPTAVVILTLLYATEIKNVCNDPEDIM